MGLPLKEVKPRRAAVIQLPHGVLVRRPRRPGTKVGDVTKAGKKKRCGVSGMVFGRNSSLNLRCKLMTLPAVRGVYGVTLTIDRHYYEGPEQVRKFWALFCPLWKRRLEEGVSENTYFVWRIELQKNGTPHWHCIFCADSERDVLHFRRVYVEAIKMFFGYDAPLDAAVNIRLLDDFSQAFGYVSAHATKHKQEQLGWRGRQWGMLFRTPGAKALYNASVVNIKEIEEKLKAADEEYFKQLEEKQDGDKELGRTDIMHDIKGVFLSEKSFFRFRRALSRLLYARFRANKVFTCKRLDRNKLRTRSSRWQAFRQVSQKCHYFAGPTAARLLEVS